jgi:hypothetical protein
MVALPPLDTEADRELAARHIAQLDAIIERRRTVIDRVGDAGQRTAPLVASLQTMEDAVVGLRRHLVGIEAYLNRSSRLHAPSED